MARAHTLADRFEAANEELVGFLEQLPDPAWDLVCPREGWPVGVTAHHVAVAYPAHMRLFRAIADGNPRRTLRRSDLDEINARHAEQFAGCGKRETTELLAAGGETVARLLRALTDEQLEERGSFMEELPRLTVAEWVELVLIGHIHMHLASIREAANT
ncbi:MAG TPA: DinB family protein [Actinomycetota bacterium]